MVRIEKVRKTVAVSGGNQQGVLDLQVSTAAELPDLGEVVCGVAVLAGSIAQVIQTGDFVTLDANGTWYPEQSDDSSSVSLNASPRTLDEPILRKDDDELIRTEFEPFPDIEQQETEPETEPEQDGDDDERELL